MKSHLIVPLAFLAVIACSPNDSANRQVGPPIQESPLDAAPQGQPDPIANLAAQKGGTFATWAGGYPKSLNAWLDYNSFSVRITELMYEPLLGMNSVQDEPNGVLASSWEISPDKMSFTFKIRPEAVWSDGQPITAEDIQYYYDVIMEPKNLTSLFRVDLSRFERPEILDDKTVRLKAKEAHWSNFWVAGGFTAFPKHVWKDRNFNEINFDFPVVSGPYRIYDVKTNRSITLQRRGDWWGRHLAYNAHKYNFDYLLFRALEDRTKALDILKRGDFDLYPIYTARIWAEQTRFPQTEKNWVVRQTVYNQEPKAFQGFAINMRRDRFQDKKVRLALAHLLNREMMLEKIMYNEYFLLNSYYPDLYPDNRNPDAPLVGYDPDKARALLKEAGWTVNNQGVLVNAQGAPFELVILNHDETVPQLTIYLEDLKAVGIQARIELISYATFTKRVDEHDFDLVWRNWGATRLRDPESMWSSKTAGEIATQNISGVQDAAIDALIEQQKLEFDLGKRNAILKKIDNRLTDIMPYVLMWQSDRNRLLYWNRFGMPASVLDKFNREEAALVYWWFDAEKSARLDEAMKKGEALPAEPETVHYQE
jgi:microcin C transport system substrate-binding protein